MASRSRSPSLSRRTRNRTDNDRYYKSSRSSHYERRRSPYSPRGQSRSTKERPQTLRQKIDSSSRKEREIKNPELKTSKEVKKLNKESDIKPDTIKTETNEFNIESFLESNSSKNNKEELLKKRREKLENWKKQRLSKLKQSQSNILTEQTSQQNKKIKFEDEIEPHSISENFKDKKVEKDDPDVDPLDAYMESINEQVQTLNEKEVDDNDVQTNTKKELKIDLKEEDVYEPEAFADEMETIIALAAKKLKKKEIQKEEIIKFEPFRKNFYYEPDEMKDMSPQQADDLRIKLDGIKIKGKNCPKPITKWSHCGLLSGCHEIIKRQGFENPTPIQAQAIPCILSGRDVIGIAKTGSGKTLAYIIPMIRHIKDQRDLDYNDNGPIAMIMTPTRELATQVYRECKIFLKILNLRAVCAYGGAPIQDQMAEIKRGVHIMVCTPGRMIDLLCANSGRLLSLKRITYLVLDEADRMFDMGFEPQVMDVLNTVRPDRQIVMFSATFPKQMEGLAKKVLVESPIEIIVGARSVVCNNVEQIIEIRESETKFNRLLEILGNYYYNSNEEDGDKRALIFVDKQDSADILLKDLMRKGYLCNSLHGGKDQSDRDSTILDFKAGIFSTLVATSVAARGLDVKKLDLVINYDCPNHMEDYVHRVGRTGRAERKGKAYTFITPEQGKYSPDIIKALRNSKAPIPKELNQLAMDFYNKVKAGNSKLGSSGFGGKGLDQLEKERTFTRFIQKKSFGTENDPQNDNDYQSDDEGTLKNIRNIKITHSTQNTKEEEVVTNPPQQNDKNTILNTGLIKAKSIIAEINSKYTKNPKVLSSNQNNNNFQSRKESTENPQDESNSLEKVDKKENLDSNNGNLTKNETSESKT